MKICHDNAITLENIVTNGNTRGGRFLCVDENRINLGTAPIIFLFSPMLKQRQRHDDNNILHFNYHFLPFSHPKAKLL